MVSRRVTILLVLLAFGAGVAVGVFGLLWATGGDATPSRDVREVAPTLSLEEAAPAAPEATEPPPTEAAANPAPPAAAPAAQRALYRITEDGSQARYKIDETLLGNRITVVGATARVAGDIIVDFANPAQSQVGVIAVNARTFRTDQEFRDQAVRGQILQTSRPENEFITFEPTSYSGLPDGPAAVGDTLDFQITGNLTVRGVTRQVTFDASVTVESEERIRGTATAKVLYRDFGIGINAPPTVSDIADEVTLEIDFVALRVEA
ncbi:MAG: YceI family protein [Aggregatilineales bacterium]